MEFLKYKSSIIYATLFASLFGAFSLKILPPEYVRLVIRHPDAGILPHWASIKDIGSLCNLILLLMILLNPFKNQKQVLSDTIKIWVFRIVSCFIIFRIADFYNFSPFNVFFVSLITIVFSIELDRKSYTTQSITVQGATVIASLLIGTMIIHLANLKLNQHMAQSVASADAFYENGQFEEAQELLQDAIKIHQKNDLKINLAKVILKNPESTKNDFEKAFSMVGDSTKLEQLIKTTALYCSEGQESAMNFVKQLNTEKSANLDISTSEIALLSPCKKESSSDLRMPASEEPAAKN